MSNELQARVDRLEAIIIGLMDEIVELKTIRQEIQANHVNQQMKQEVTEQQVLIEIQKQQAAMQNAQLAAQQNVSTSTLFGLNTGLGQAQQGSIRYDQDSDTYKSNPFNKIAGVFRP